MSNKELFKILVERIASEIIIPNDVVKIGENAFQLYSNLKNITLPNSITSIGKYAFYGCSGLTSITLPNSITSIGKYAFYGCSGLTSITIPSSVTSIENSAFNNCSNLTTVTFNQPNGMTVSLPTAGSGSGMLYNKTAREVTIYTDNETIKNYDWATDNVTPTFYHLDGTAWA